MPTCAYMWVFPTDNKVGYYITSNTANKSHYTSQSLKSSMPGLTNSAYYRFIRGRFELSRMIMTMTMMTTSVATSLQSKGLPSRYWACYLVVVKINSQLTSYYSIISKGR